MLQSQGKIVLVRPRDPNNIGAVARAMKNFGFADLWIVALHPPTWEEITAAPNALDVVRGARLVPTLAAAVADCELVLGTGDSTRALAPHDATPHSAWTPQQLSGELERAPRRFALVFGNEKHGLTNAELSHCHRLLTIPTQRACPSMNLGQAVAICLYELTRTAVHATATTATNQTNEKAEWPTAGASEALLQLALEMLARSEFILPGNDAKLAQRLRAGLLKYGLSPQDTTLLCGILHKVNRRLRTSSGRPNEDEREAEQTGETENRAHQFE